MGNIKCSDGTFCHSLLHFTCRFQVPLYVIKRVVKLCENQISETDCAYRLPFHIAIENKAPYDVIEFLLKKKISAASQVDAKGNTALHMAILGYKKKKKDSKGDFGEYNHYLKKVIILLCRVAPSSLHETNANGLVPYGIATTEGVTSDILTMLHTKNN